MTTGKLWPGLAAGLALILAACGGGSAAPASSAAAPSSAAAKPASSAGPASSAAAKPAASASAKPAASGAASAKPAASGAAATSGAAAAGKKMKIALLLPGPAQDQGFDQAAYEGLQALKQQGNDTAFTENVQDNQQENVLRSYAKQNYDLIFAHGFQFTDAVQKVAPDYPKIWFAVTASSFKPKVSNVISTGPQPSDASYLLGVAMGGVSKTKKIGGVIGQDIPTVHDQADNVQAGAAWLDPSVKMTTVYVGDWNDSAKGKQLAESLISQGNDVIWGNQNQGSRIIAQTAADKGMFSATYGYDLSKELPKSFVAGLLDNYPAILGSVAANVASGKAKAEYFAVGLKDNGTNITPPEGTDLVPANVKAKIDEARKMIVAGTPPPGYKAYDIS
jgi:basic membrane protein A and related proteins